MLMRRIRLIVIVVLSAGLVLGLAAQSPDRARQLKQARELVAAGKTDEAIAIYAALVKQSPADPSLRVNLAISQFKAGHYAETIAHCRKALEQRPGMIPALLFLGAAYAKLGRPAEAVEPLRKVVVARPKERNARLMLAESLLRVGKFEEAAEHFRAASSMLPRSPRVWYGLERCYTVLAEAEFERLARLAPGSAYIEALLGDARMEQEQYEAAFARYRRALALDAGLTGVHTALAEIYERTGHPDWAAVERKREPAAPADCRSSDLACLFAHEQFLDLLRANGSAFWKKRAYDRLAEQAFAKLAALPDSAELHELKARRLDSAGSYTAAVNEWTKALALSPGNAVLNQGLATALFHARDYEAALPLLEKLLEQKPDSAEFLFLCGDALLSLKRPRDATGYLESSVERDPTNLFAHAELGRAYLELGDGARAIPHLLTALPADEDGTRHFELARAYRMTGDTKRAKETLTEYSRLRKEAAERERERERRRRVVAPE